MDSLIYFRTWSLTSGEMITYTVETKSQIENAGGAETLGIGNLYPVFSELSDKLQQTYHAAANNPVTVAKEEAESYRDNRYNALVAFVRNASYDSNEEVSVAAESIMDVINAIGNPTRLGDSQETAELYNLSSRLATLEPQLNFIGASLRLQELNEANHEFERLQNEWYKAGSQKMSGHIVSMRQQLAPVYKSIIYRINALIEVNGIAPYKTFVDSHNQMVEYYRNIVAQRKGRKKAKKEDAEVKNG